MDKFVIAITRTCGSGATSIGKILAKNLGVEIYDRNILRLASDDSGISEELFARAESRKSVEETDSSGGSRTTDEQDWGEETVYYEDGSGGKSPYVVKELEPNIEGVLVLAEGGDSAVVKQELLEAVQALFPIEAHKVKIMKLEGAK